MGGQSERVIHILEDMLRCCVLEFEANWEKYLPLVEFAYSNNYQSSIKMEPYEALYGWKCKTPLYWTELSEKNIHGVDLIRETEEKVKSYADLKRKEMEFQVADKFDCKGKLSPRFIGPYEITEKIGPVVYRLALPPKLDRIHKVEIQPDITYSEELI
ncbi:polyprotein [Gossypium australe]|uniref:Polyprotein n=1 Tax=Gossypium australe TaxID=47621 RepID=A0A5B6VD80_9ROSI|nr:polyprotein [Gossypium australe]